MTEALCMVCEERPATDACTREWPTRGACLCRVCHAHQRMAFPCDCMTTKEAIAIGDANGGPEATKAALLTIAKLPKERPMAKKKDKRADDGANGNAARPLPAGVPAGAVARDHYEERLPCKSDAIVAEKARELAKLEHQRTVWRVNWKAQCIKARERRAFFEERIEELADEVDRKVEYRNVEVVEYLLPTNEVLAVRGDTGEVIARRTAEADDLQEPIPGTEKVPPPSADDAANGAAASAE